LPERPLVESLDRLAIDNRHGNDPEPEREQRFVRRVVLFDVQFLERLPLA